MAGCEVALLGGFRVVVDGRPVPDAAWKRSRAAALVKILALAGERRVHREQVMDVLWPDLPPPAAAANLRKAIHYARAALGDARAVAQDGDLLVLMPDIPVVVDAARFESVARPALAGLASLDEALGLYTGDLLPGDRYAPWADDPRDRLRGLYLGLLKRAQRWDELLAADPDDEDAHRALMQRALDAGDRATVIRQFGRLRQRLRADLGVGPGAATLAVYEKALALGPSESEATREHVQAILARAIIALHSGDLTTATSTAQQARDMSIEANLGREMGEACAVLGIVANMQNRWPAVFEADFSRALHEDQARSAYLFDAHLCLAEYSLDGPAGHQYLASRIEKLRLEAERVDSVRGLGWADLISGEAALFSGELDRAERMLTSALKLHHLADARGGEVMTLQRLAELAVARGQRAEAIAIVRRALALAPSSWLEPHLLVRLLAVRVEASPSPTIAVQIVEKADAALHGRTVCPPCSIGFWIAAAVNSALAGRLTRARHHLEAAERLVGLWPAGPWHAAIWEARGVLRRAEGHDDQAVVFFAEAANRFAAVNRPSDQRRCLARAHPPRPSSLSSGDARGAVRRRGAGRGSGRPT